MTIYPSPASDADNPEPTTSSELPKTPPDNSHPVLDIVGPVCAAVVMFLLLYGAGTWVYNQFNAEEVREFTLNFTARTGLRAKSDRIAGEPTEWYTYTYNGKVPLKDADVTVVMYFEDGTQAEEKRYWANWHPNEKKTITSANFLFSKMQKLEIKGSAKKDSREVVLAGVVSDLEPHSGNFAGVPGKKLFNDFTATAIVQSGLIPELLGTSAEAADEFDVKNTGAADLENVSLSISFVAADATRQRIVQHWAKWDARTTITIRHPKWRENTVAVYIQGTAFINSEEVFLDKMFSSE